MAIKIVKSTGDAGAYEFGIKQDEFGINVRRMQVRFFPEVNERFKNWSGQTFLRSVSMNFSRELTCEGEITSGGGVCALTLGIACTFANIHQNYPYQTGGTFFLDEAVVSLERRGWRSVSVRASSDWLL